MAKSSPRWFVSFPISFIGLNVIIAVAVALAFYVSWYAGIAASIVLAIALTVAGFGVHMASLFWVAIIALTAGITCGIEFCEYSALSRGEIRRLASPSEAPAQKNTTGYIFEQAVVRTDLSTLYVHRSTSRRHHGSPTSSSSYFYIAPLVAGDWTTDQPVPAWVVCRTTSCRADWEKPQRAAIAAPSLDSDRNHKAAAAAESERGLTSIPGAPVLAWVASPAEAIAAQLHSAIMSVVLWNAVWLFGWLVYGIVKVVQLVRGGGAPA